MKLNITEFSGMIEAAYKIDSAITSGSKAVTLRLNLKLPFQNDFMIIDSIDSGTHKTSTENFEAAFKLAAERWNKTLVKETLENYITP